MPIPLSRRRTTLPHSAGHAAVFSFTKTMADLLQAVLGCLSRLGGVPDAMVVDNDSSIVADGVGRNARLHPEVAALCGHLGMRLIVLDPGKPESKGPGRADQRVPGGLVPAAPWVR